MGADVGADGGAGHRTDGGPLVEVVAVHRLAFGPDDPVRAASAIARLGDRWLVAQDDANHAAWWDPRSGWTDRIRVFPSDDGVDLFGEAAGTKRRKPDLEAACTLPADEGDAVVLLGSGSLPLRRRGASVRLAAAGGPVYRTADLGPLYDRVTAAFGIATDQLNLEGACLVGDALRWFQRGHGGSGVASASIDLPWRDLVAAIEGDADPGRIALDRVRRYDLGSIGGVALTITDAAALGPGRIVVSASAEDSPDAVADGPVVGSVLGLIDGESGGESGGGATEPVEVVELPASIAGCKIEGIAPLTLADGRPGLLAVVDEDDPGVASLAIELALATA